MNRPIPQPSALTLLSREEIREIAREGAAEALADFTPPERPALHDRHGLARELGCSVATLDKLRSLPGFPELRLLDAPRFELAEVLAWVRTRKVSE